MRARYIRSSAPAQDGLRRGLTIDLGGETFSASNLSGQDGFVLKLSSAGNYLWSKSLGSSSASVDGIALDPFGTVILTGWFSDRIDLGNGAVTTSPGEFQLYVAKLGANGSFSFLNAYGSLDRPMFSSRVACDNASNVFVGGTFGGSLDFGGGALTAPAAGSAFLAKLGTDGSHAWSKAFGNGFAQMGGSVAVDATGNAYFTGSFAGSVNFGAGIVTAASQESAFVLKFAPDGSAVWTRAYGSTGTQLGLGIGVDAGGVPLVAGAFSGKMDLGAGVLTSVGNDDVFLGRIAA